MRWNQHLEEQGTHAPFSASSYHWINYSEEKLEDVYRKRLATLKGTELHDFAAHCIEMREKLPKTRRTLNLFVNDAIAYHMNSEQVLKYSDNFFGTADAISFSSECKKDKRMMLRIHDLKTGEVQAHMEQLLVYAALFCLEYHVKPSDIDIELRIYQFDNITIFNPTVEDVLPIMDKIVSFDKILNKIDMEGE